MAEIPIDTQWKYLDSNRSELQPNTLIPPVRPDVDRIRDYTRQVLKDGKGWGRAADLLELLGIPL